MAWIFGLDFGTTNSLASLVIDGKPLSFVNADDQLPHPSVIRYHGNEVVVGRRAKQEMESTGTGVIGDFVRSPKRYLGSGSKIHVGGVGRAPSEVVAEILRHIRTDARQRNWVASEDFSKAVMTVPVTANGAARRDLREAALRAGIHIFQFVPEPFAALYGYLRTMSDYKRKLAELDGQLILVFDWGGGTLDLTLSKVSKGMLVEVQSKGDDTVGGDKFDDRLIGYVKKEHAAQHGLANLDNELPHVEAKLISQCEEAKINLSTWSSATVGVAHYLSSDGPEHTLEVVLTRDQLVELTKDIVDAGMRNIDELLASAGVNPASIALCVATGGMVRMPYIRERLLERFDPLRVPQIDNGDRIISEGAAWIAHDQLRLCLAKPFEMLLGSDDYSTLIEAHTPLPTENKSETFEFDTYCVDPRDGFAKFQFARPVWPGRSHAGDPRRSYATLLVAIDPDVEPLVERLQVSVTIDHNLVATVAARSTGVGHPRSREVHDLEFGLAIGAYEPRGTQDKDDAQSEIPKPRHAQGSVKLRSNVVRGQHAWELVPGDIIGHYRPSYLDPILQKRQLDEKMYYVPCGECRRTIHEVRIQGCTLCNSPLTAEAPVRRKRLEQVIADLSRQEQELADR